MSVEEQGPLVAGEVPRVAFISSVMDGELDEVRRRVVGTLQRAPFLLPWAFEMTPASSGEPVGEYLRKVREATFVFWFAADRTTPPVEKEIAEAIASGKRLLVFLLPASERDRATTELLAQVREHCRYRELANLERLEEEVEAAISDELSRALDGRPSLSRSSASTLSGARVDANCIATFYEERGLQAIGSGGSAAFVAHGLLRHYQPREQTVEELRLIAYRTIRTCIDGLGGQLGVGGEVHLWSCQQGQGYCKANTDLLQSLEEGLAKWKTIERESLSEAVGTAPAEDAAAEEGVPEALDGADGSSTVPASATGSGAGG